MEVLIVLLILLLGFALAIALPLWTYSDAQSNSSQSALLWALVVFFGGILGLILYVIIGRDRRGGHSSPAY